jgi:molecular chaperone GrpE
MEKDINEEPKAEAKEDVKKTHGSGKEIDELRKQVEELQNEKQQLFEQLQRLSADYMNYQKRAPRQVADSIAYEKKAIFRSLLPSLDNFQHALSGAAGARGEEALDKVIHGIQLVFDHMLDALKVHGVVKIEAAGKPFDPTIHEAMMQRTEEDKPDHIVLEEFQSGYLLNDQVLRPAKVIVNKNPGMPLPEEAEKAAAKEEDNRPEPEIQNDETTEIEQ